MKGQHYIKQMTDEESENFRDEFVRQKSLDEFIDYLETNFDNITDFFECSFYITTRSEKGYDYWIETFNKYNG